MRLTAFLFATLCSTMTSSRANDVRQGRLCGLDETREHEVSVRVLPTCALVRSVRVRGVSSLELEIPPANVAVIVSSSGRLSVLLPDSSDRWEITQAEVVDPALFRSQKVTADDRGSLVTRRFSGRLFAPQGVILDQARAVTDDGTEVPIACDAGGAFATDVVTAKAITIVFERAAPITLDGLWPDGGTVQVAAGTPMKVICRAPQSRLTFARMDSEDVPAAFWVVPLDSEGCADFPPVASRRVRFQLISGSRRSRWVWIESEQTHRQQLRAYLDPPE